MLERLEVEEILTKFGKNLVTQSGDNLTRSSSRDTDSLYNSLDYEVNASENSFQFDFIMNEHGEYIDKGVRGAGGVRKTTSTFNNRNNKGKLWKIKAKNSPYKFGKSGGISPSHFKNWAQSRGLSEFAVAKAVYHQGIEPTYFYSKPFEKAFKELPDELVEAYALDLERFMEITLTEKTELKTI